MYGSLQQSPEGRWQLRFERTYASPLDRVWRAVTEPEELAAWFPTTIEGTRAAGAPLRFSFQKNEAPSFDGQMLAFEPPSVIELLWGTDIVRIELSRVPDGTALTLLVTLDEQGKAARDGAGWHVCLDALATSLAGDDQAEVGSWKVVHDVYVDRFGPEAATTGPPPGAAQG